MSLKWFPHPEKQWDSAQKYSFRNMRLKRNHICLFIPAAAGWKQIVWGLCCQRRLIVFMLFESVGSWEKHLNDGNLLLTEHFLRRLVYLHSSNTKTVNWNLFRRHPTKQHSQVKTVVFTYGLQLCRPRCSCNVHLFAGRGIYSIAHSWCLFYIKQILIKFKEYLKLMLPTHFYPFKSVRIKP